jgi:hypothetical protein
MSETPRTDALLNNKEVVVDCAFLDFARQLERELAAKDTEKYCFASCAFHAAQDAEIARLREAAKAVVQRWETPLWKDVEPTAHVIYALRDELAAQQQANK